MHLFVLERLPVFSKYTETHVGIVSVFGVNLNSVHRWSQSGGQGIQSGPLPGKSQVLYKHAFETNEPL